MRCSCKVCGPEYWMVQAESQVLGCVCTECGYRCTDCLGTDTVVPRDRVSDLAWDPRFSPENLQALFDGTEDEESLEEDFPSSGFDSQKYGGF